VLKTNPDVDESLRSLLRLCRGKLVRSQKIESALVRLLERDRLLAERSIDDHSHCWADHGADMGAGSGRQNLES